LGGHAVVCFGYDDDDGQLFVYDPNHPGDSCQIVFDKAQKKFNNYDSVNFDKFALVGSGSLRLKEPYEAILADAKINFHSSTMPIINVNSHHSGDTVYTHNITISGNIDSVEVLVERLEIIIGSDRFSGNVDQNGNFSIPVTLSNGINRLLFATYGKNGVGTEIQITPTNIDTQIFTIKLDIPNSVILMTLTWDKNDTDLDTYVIDPTGDYSCYYRMRTADGGELDRDDVDGYGPEHWTLMNTDTVRYNQPYRFRVHYYSDHGRGGTNYTVTIKLYEGTSREVTYSYGGYLSANAPSNSSPNATGPDWADIATLTLTQGTSASINSISSESQESDEIIIT